jgi:hypothetical protein
VAALEFHGEAKEVEAHQRRLAAVPFEMGDRPMGKLQPLPHERFEQGLTHAPRIGRGE